MKFKTHFSQFQKVNLRPWVQASLLFVLVVSFQNCSPYRNVGEKSGAEQASEVSAVQSQEPRSAFLAGDPTPHPATLWRHIELVFESSETYTNPYKEVELDAVFTSPSGRKIRRPGFWDGGGTWRVRFAPDEKGRWSYQTTANVSGDKAFFATGAIDASVQNETLDVFKRGFVQSQGKRYLTYADGTPFFFSAFNMDMQDMGEFEDELGGVKKTDWNPMVANPNSQILGILDNALYKKFNTVGLSFFYLKFNENGHKFGDMINPDRFRSHYDRLMEEVARRGLVASISLAYAAAEGELFNAESTTTPKTGTAEGLERMKRYARYVIARYGAYPTMFHLSEPDAPGTYTSFSDISYWREVFKYVAQIDDYDHPLGPWYWRTTGADPSFGLTPNFYLDIPGVSMIITQCGHTKAYGDYSRGGEQKISTYNFYYKNYPHLPMLEAGGCNFENIYEGSTTYVARRSAWRAVQNGSAGFGFGQQGIWNMTSNYFHLSYDNGKNIPWQEGIDMPGGWHMAFLYHFYQALDWTSLVPQNMPEDSIVGFKPTSALTEHSTPMTTANEERSTIVIYYPGEFGSIGPSGTIYTLNPEYTYRMRWYDPRTGEYIGIANGVVHNGSLELPEKLAGHGDWVLLMEKDGAASASGANANLPPMHDIYEIANSGFTDIFYSHNPNEGAGVYEPARNTLRFFSSTNSSYKFQAVYRCRDDNGGFHFATTDATCSGRVQEGSLGYVLAEPWLGVSTKSLYLCHNGGTLYPIAEDCEKWGLTTVEHLGYVPDGQESSSGSNQSSSASQENASSTDQQKNEVASFPSMHKIYELAKGYKDFLYSYNSNEAAGVYSWRNTLYFYSSTNNSYKFQAIYRCRDDSAGFHFVTTDATCSGRVQEGSLGYTLKEAPSNVSTTSLYLCNNGSTLYSIAEDCAKWGLKSVEHLGYVTW